MGQNKEGDERISPEEATFAIQGGFAVVRQQLDAFNEVAFVAKNALNEATILELFNPDRSSLTPEQIELLTTAAEGLEKMVELLARTVDAQREIAKLFPDE